MVGCCHRFPSSIVKLVIVLCLFNPCPLAIGQTITGRVFEDANGNGIYDEGEKVIAGVIVTDGDKVTVTDANGQYKLVHNQPTRFVYITQPTGWKATGGWFKRLSDVKADKTFQVDFPMVRQTQQTPFIFAHITDVHIASPANALSLHKLLTELDGAKVKPSFVVITGDLVALGDAVTAKVAKQWFELFTGASEGVSLPIYHVVGNHDVVGVNFKGDDGVDAFSDDYGKGMFEAQLNPRYYGFEYGGIHFLALDLHPIYDRRQAIGLDPKQVEWLRQYARCLKTGTRLIIFTHAPIVQMPAQQAIWLLGTFSHCKLLSIHSGHDHRTYSINFGSFRQFVSGALSGSWWTGANSDGYPQGFSIVTVGDDKVDVRYTPAWKKLAPIPVEPPVTIAHDGFYTIPIYSGAQKVVIQTLRMHADAKSVRARIGSGKWVEMRKARDEACTSLWEGVIETNEQPDGMTMLTIQASSDGLNETAQYRIFVYNARTPYEAREDATLQIELDEVDGIVTVLFEGEEVAKVRPNGDTKRVSASVSIPKRLLTRKVAFVRLMPGAIDNSQVDDFVIRSASLIYGGRKLTDERIIGTHAAGDDAVGKQIEATLLFELP